MSQEKQMQHFTLGTSVKNGGSREMVWPCFAAWGPGHLAIIEETMNSALYQKIQGE